MVNDRTGSAELERLIVRAFLTELTDEREDDVLRGHTGRSAPSSETTNGLRNA